MPFEKLESKRKSAHVVEQIVKAIQKGIYEVGDKLPPERVIAEETGVSRPSVREALSILAASGVVRRRAGDGTYVQSSNERDLSKALSMPQEDVNLFEVFELQRTLEPAVAELAIDKISEEDLNQLEKALRQMRAAVEDGNRDKYVDGDRAFHMAIARATKNSLIEQHVVNLINLMNQRLWREFKSYSVDLEREKEYFIRSMKAHEQMFEAIKNKDKKRLREIMEKHFQRVEERVFKGL
jgi:GntR family transcriptional repressor for pyruvate dehydrogenase complex